MPCTPMADKASRTSSSLNGLMMAVINFMVSPVQWNCEISAVELVLSSLYAKHT
jgi:hypothetical protein